jgi:hypothetical protein
MADTGPSRPFTKMTVLSTRDADDEQRGPCQGRTPRDCDLPAQSGIVARDHRVDV